ncbi:MAG: hypothetical protein WCI72_00665 [archaeon]
MKNLRIDGKDGCEIDFDVLKTLDANEWQEWIHGRLFGRDPYGFPVGGTHAHVEPSVYFGEVADKIQEGDIFPEAERAVEAVIAKDGMKSSSGYTDSELFRIACDVTRPNLGYNATTVRVANAVRENKYKMMPKFYKESYLESAIGLLMHMQSFEDKQFRDIYSNFLIPATELDNPFGISLNSFLGLQVSYDLFKVDELAVKTILDSNKGNERNLEITFRCLGDVLKRKSDFYFDGLREKAKKREEENQRGDSK